MQHATTCHQQSVRSNESLLRPATRRSGITSLRRSGRTSRCGRNNPRYVCNALSHAGSVSSVYFLFPLRNLKQSQNLLAICSSARLHDTSKHARFANCISKIWQVSDNWGKSRIACYKKEIGQTHASLRALQFDTLSWNAVTVWQINPVGNTHNIKNNIWNRR